MTLSCNAQNDSLPPIENMGSCEDGIKKANADAKNGKYKLLSYGLPFYDDWDFQNYYEEFVFKKYGIEIGNGGCVVYDETECYSTKMSELIFAKFGDDILKKAKLEAQVEYKVNIKEKIDTGYIFSSVDSMPNFIGGNDSLFAFLQANMKNIANSEGKVIAFFIVEKNGSISNVKIQKGLNEKADNEVKRVLNIMPKWNSGYHFGEFVRVRIAIPISFKAKKE